MLHALLCLWLFSNPSMRLDIELSTMHCAEPRNEPCGCVQRTTLRRQVWLWWNVWFATSQTRATLSCAVHLAEAVQGAMQAQA